jgi:hypothetical protein
MSNVCSHNLEVCSTDMTAQDLCDVLVLIDADDAKVYVSHSYDLEMGEDSDEMWFPISPVMDNGIMHMEKVHEDVGISLSAFIANLGFYLKHFNEAQSTPVVFMDEDFNPYSVCAIKYMDEGIVTLIVEALE